MRNTPVTSPVYYPIFLNIQGKKCTVIGGGKVAVRKVRMLLNHGPKLTVISPKPDPEMVRLSQERLIRLLRRDYRRGDLQGSALAIAATDAEEINHRAVREAKRNGILVNVVDDPGSSDFIIPSFFKRGDLTVAVSTAGKSPAFAKKIRRKLERSLGREYASLLSLVSEARSVVKEKGHAIDGEVWQKALDLDSLIGFIKKGQRKQAKAILIKNLESHCADP